MIQESISPLQKYPDEVTTRRLCPALLKEKTVYLPIGYIFCYLLFKHWPHSESEFSLPWCFLLFYTITTVFVFQSRLSHHVNLVTFLPHLVPCFPRNSVVFSKLKCSALNSKITASYSCPLKRNCKLKAIQLVQDRINKKQSFSQKQVIKCMLIWHNGPTHVLAQKAQHCDRDTSTVRQKRP